MGNRTPAPGAGASPGLLPVTGGADRQACPWPPRAPSGLLGPVSVTGSGVGTGGRTAEALPRPSEAPPDGREGLGAVVPRSGSGWGAQERAGFLPGQQRERGPQSPRGRGKQEPIRGCEITEGKTMKGPHVAWREKGKQQCFPQPPCTPVPPTNYRLPTSDPACNLRPKTCRGPTHPTPPHPAPDTHSH